MQHFYGTKNITWLEWRHGKFETLHAKGSCEIAGDARCDSPGHCTKY